jgi:hypothetical protein
MGVSSDLVKMYSPQGGAGLMSCRVSAAADLAKDMHPAACVTIIMAVFSRNGYRALIF